MELFLNNLTFHNCPVELREKAAFSSDRQPGTEQLQAADLINKMFLSQDRRSQQ